MEEHVIDFLPEYALGMLDEEDILRVIQHLSDCAACRREYELFRETAAQIPMAVQFVEPPARLKQKVLDRISSQVAGSDRIVRSGRERGALQKGAPVRSWWQQLASLLRPATLGWALAVILVVGLGLSSLLLWQQVNELRTAQQGNPLVDPNLHMVKLQGTTNAPQAHAYLMVLGKQEYGTLVVENAPPLKMGRQYQLWLNKNGKRTNGGVFSVNSDGYGILEVAAGEPLADFMTFGVTIEPWGGSPGPTGPKVLGGGT